MPIGAAEDFNAEETAMLDALRKDDDDTGGADDADTGPLPGVAAANSDPEVVAAVAAATAGDAEAAAASTQQAADDAARARASNADDDRGGSVTAALRASRRAERLARERAEQLAAEVEQLRAKVPSTPDPDALSAEELAELETDLPAVGKVARQLQKLQQQRAAAPTQRQAGDDDFTPPVQRDPEVQDAIDSNPDLLTWQTSKDQAAFQLAAETDALLRKSPRWANVSMSDRFAEVVRRVHADLGTTPGAPAASPTPAPPAPARRDPNAAVRAAPVRAPSSLSDIAGGGTAAIEAPGLQQFMKMSDDDIMASLAQG